MVWLMWFESYVVWWQHDDSRSQELIERKIQNAPAGQGTVRMLSREEWEEIREVRPRTPFESKLARPNAQVRTGESLHLVRHLILLYLLYCLFAYISRDKLFLFVVGSVVQSGLKHAQSHKDLAFALAKAKLFQFFAKRYMNRLN
jgi:hypothetical protein